MRTRLPFARWAALGALALAACGSEPGGGAPTGIPWKRTALAGVSGVTAAAHHEGWLLLAAGNERRLFAVRSADLEDGGRADARELPLTVARERALEGYGVGRGGDDLVAQGYRLAQIFDQPLAFAGLYVRRVAAAGAGGDVERLYLLDGSHGIVAWGQLERDPQGDPVGARVEHAFVAPGRERAGASRLDWRDTSAGLAGVLSPRTPQGEEDLLLVERGREGEAEVLVRRLDRFGQPRSTLRVGLPAEHRRPVVACAEAQAGRIVLLLAGAEPLLVVAPLDTRRDGVPAEGGIRAPAAPPGEAWRALAYSADGAEFLVSGGSAPVLVWR